MGFDLTGIDAELSALDPPPHVLEAQGARLAISFSTLSEVDESLAALESSLDQPLVLIDASLPPRAPSPRAEPRPKSGEISLGEPVQRRSEPAPASAELMLFDSDRPSGAFELDDFTTRNEDFEVDPFASQKRAPESAMNPISLSPAGSRAPSMEITTIAIDPHVGHTKIDVIEASSALFSQEGEPDTMVLSVDSDPDAAFDALFDEATHPSGIPTRAFDPDDETLTADDLLSGLTDPGEHESEAATNALFTGLDISETTDIIDTNAFDADPFPSDEELGSSEFEIMLDSQGEARDILAARPPQQVDLGPTDKRPSFLGRLFGRKDDK